MRTPVKTELESHTQTFYRDALEVLEQSGIPYLVGGAYALRAYTGIHRHTRDFDVFLRPADCRRALDFFAARGYPSELTYPHWLGKCRRGDDYVDLIFSSGNGIATVDDAWFERAEKGVVFDRAVRLCPPEEMIWSKGYIMERERFDGADVAHLIRARGADLDWDHLTRRFRPHPHVLLVQILLFEFVYPEQRGVVPERIRRELLGAIQAEAAGPARERPVCRGTLLSRSQYLVDLERGYLDARLAPFGPLDPEQLERWTAEAQSL